MKQIENMVEYNFVPQDQLHIPVPEVYVCCGRGFSKQVFIVDGDGVGYSGDLVFVFKGDKRVGVFKNVEYAYVQYSRKVTQ